MAAETLRQISQPSPEDWESGLSIYSRDPARMPAYFETYAVKSKLLASKEGQGPNLRDRLLATANVDNAATGATIDTGGTPNTMPNLTREELDAKLELMDTRLATRIQQAVDAMQSRDAAQQHALEKMQAEFVARDLLYVERSKLQDLSAQKVLNEVAGRDAVMELRHKNVADDLAKMADATKAIKANIWLGVATTAAIVGATVAIAIASFDSGRETAKSIAESTVKLEQLIKSQEEKAKSTQATASPSIAPASSSGK